MKPSNKRQQRQSPTLLALLRLPQFRGQDPSGKAKILLGLVIKEFGLACAKGKKDGILYRIEKKKVNQDNIKATASL